MTIRKTGGIWHWRIGRLVGSICVIRPKTVWETIAENRRRFDRDMAQLQRRANRSV